MRRLRHRRVTIRRARQLSCSPGHTDASSYRHSCTGRRQLLNLPFCRSKGIGSSRRAARSSTHMRCRRQGRAKPFSLRCPVELGPDAGVAVHWLSQVLARSSSIGISVWRHASRLIIPPDMPPWANSGRWTYSTVGSSPRSTPTTSTKAARSNSTASAILEGGSTVISWARSACHT